MCYARRVVLLLAKHRRHQQPLRSLSCGASFEQRHVRGIFRLVPLAQPSFVRSEYKQYHNRQYQHQHQHQQYQHQQYHKQQQVRHYVKPKFVISICDAATASASSSSSNSNDNSNSNDEDDDDDVFHHHHPLDPHIQSCLPNAVFPIQQQQQQSPVVVFPDTGFHVCFLGTSAGSPTKDRLCTATVLRLGGQSLLFDAAEGVQRQLMHTRIQMASITKIFITHLHADHVLGLPGMLLALQLVSQNQQRSSSNNSNNNNSTNNDDDSTNNNKVGMTIELYGPPGLYNYVAMSLSLTMTSSTAGQIIVHELVGGYADPGGDRDQPEGTLKLNNNNKNKNKRRDPRHANYQEMSRHNLHRKTIAPNPDGTWTLLTPPTTSNGTSSNGNHLHHHTQTQNFITVMAAEVQHVDGVMTFGYVVQEQQPQPAINVDKARACGVAPGIKYRLLKEGIPVPTDDSDNSDNDDGIMVQPSQVLEASTKKARKLAILGDNCQLSPALYDLCRDCDVLVHEATLFEEEDDDDDEGSDHDTATATVSTAAFKRHPRRNSSTIEQLAHKRGHASPEMAGQVARAVNAKVLVLNHITSKIGESDLPRVVALAERGAGDTTNSTAAGPAAVVVVAHDFMELLVPIKGFDDAVLQRTNEQTKR